MFFSLFVSNERQDSETESSHDPREGQRFMDVPKKKCYLEKMCLFNVLGKSIMLTEKCVI